MADFNRQQTALALIQEVCAQQGLPIPVAAASNPDDRTANQLLAVLRYTGRRLCKPTDGYRWRFLTRLWTLNTVPGTTLYDLPTDWDSFEDLTGWNFTSALPLLGPATDPQWQCLKARNLGSSTISIIYRPIGGKFELYESPSQSQRLGINYTSRGWVRDATNATRYKDTPENDGDLVLFDGDLMTAAMRVAFLTAKGFDTTSSMAEYRVMLEAAMCADSDAPVLSLAVNDTYPLISTQYNAPDTGYGG